MGVAGGAGADSESAFRAGLPKLLAQWQQRVGNTAAAQAEAAQIGGEVTFLRQQCQSRRWMETAELLSRLERAAAHSPQALGAVLKSVAAIVTPGARPGADHGATLRLDSPFANTPPPGQPRAPGPVANPANHPVTGPGTGPRPAVVGQPPGPGAPRPPGPEAPGGKDALFGFRAFGQSPPRESDPDPVNAPPAILGLSSRMSDPERRPPAFILPHVSRSVSRRSTPSSFDGRGSTAARSKKRGQTTGIAVGIAAVVIVAGLFVYLLRRPRPSGSIAEGKPTGAAEGTAMLADASGQSAAFPNSGPVEEISKRVQAQVEAAGQESPELRDLIKLQSALAARCVSDPSTCGHGWTPYSREAIESFDGGVLVHRASEGPLSAWLQRLKVPQDFPLHDNPAVRGVFDFNTKNIAGRQHFQARYFACSAYADIFESTLEKYGAPLWLIAVVYQESGCEPTATSPTGARGLWQFMPESARAYGLRVVDGEVDERLNSIKSTDAAIHFLTDLRRQMGAWDLALAAYNLGPYGLMARIIRVGGDAGFWDLVDANILPDETAGYVPAIEAYALVLENLTRLEFSRDGRRLESTAEIMTKPGVRLSLLARAAHTSTLRIRDLNPEFLRDVVPDGETSARVPDSEAHRAQVFLETLPPSDDRDTCVPEDFDWGAKVFETSKYAATCHDPGAAAVHSDVPQAPPAPQVKAAPHPLAPAPPKGAGVGDLKVPF